jgi:hypothetical protein
VDLSSGTSTPRRRNQHKNYRDIEEVLQNFAAGCRTITVIKTDDLTEALARVEDLQSVELVQWSVTSADDGVTVALAGELDLSGAETVSQLLRHVVATGPAMLNVDLAHLSFLDSTGIQCLVDGA